MRWKKRKKKLDEKYEYFWNNIGTDGIGDVVTLQNHISYWTDKSGTVLVELEEEKRMATLKDLLVETYDIFIDGDKYFCVPKFGVIDQDFDYEMRDVSELDCEIGQVDGFNNNRFSVEDFITTGMVALSTAAWSPPNMETNNTIRGKIREWVSDGIEKLNDMSTKEITDNAGMNSGADT